MNHDRAEIIIADFFLDNILSSDRYATPGSKIEIEELSAATDNSIKNIGPIIYPNCISLKVEAIDIKTRPGPLALSSPICSRVS